MLWCGETVSGLGNGITVVGLPLIAVQVLDAGSTAVGLISAAVWLPWLLVGLPVGAWVDRMRKRPLMIACDLVAATALLSIPLATWRGALALPQVIVVALVCGTSAVCFNTAYHAYIRIVLDGRDLLEGNAELQGGEAATQVAGPGVAGALTQALGAVAGLVADAVTFLVSAVCLRRIRAVEPDPAPDGERDLLRRQILQGLRFVGRDRYLRWMVTWGAVINMALMGCQAGQVVFLVRTVGLDPATVGLLLFVTGALVVGTGVSVADVVVGTFRQTYCPPHMLGRVVATAMTANHSTIPLGSLLGGVLGDAVGCRRTMWIMTGVIALSWLVLAVGPLRHERDLPRTRAPEQVRRRREGERSAA
ncbi:MFS transporter [Streptomyces sp. MST-110588]|uniref:MFS transporter n=1 Tax=Streptomyces sp. MST-110588 TaxID=2833628 RepID=UPI0020587BE5|nr:MFS transporter [Streptomyces sp. MST-110588]UNO44332.1 MFS transporter [Streptomyces sp. MST-110588]